MHRALLVLAFLLSQTAGYVWAQATCNLQLKGEVVETHNYEPVYPATIYIDELKQSFETDERGKFLVPALCDGTYMLHIHAANHAHYDQQIHVHGNETMRFKMTHSDNELNELIVKEDRTKTVLQSRSQLSKSEIDANSGKTLAQMLQNVNGVTMLSNGGTIAKPVIHGLHSNRIVMLNNGIRQEDQQWGSEHAPNIDPFLASNIVVIKGAASVRYGTDAIGGVVLVEPAALPTKPGWAGEVNLAGFSNNRMGVSSAVIEHNFKGLPSLSMRVQGTYKKGGNYRIPGYWAANTGVAESNYSAALGWRRAHYGTEVFYSHFNTDLGVYRGSHTGSEKDLLVAINSDTPTISAGFTYDIERPKQHVEHNMLKSKTYLDTRIGMWNFVYAYQNNFRQEYDVMRVEDGKAQLNLTLQTHTANINLDHKKIGRLNGQVGIDGIYQDNTFKNGDRLFIPTYNSAGAAAYAIERYKGRNWTLEGGLRYDYRMYEVYNPQGKNQSIVQYNYDYNSLSGTLGFNKQVNTAFNYSITLANAWRAPQANELFSAGLHHGAARIELGNKDLVPERSYNLNVELKYTHKKFVAEASLYSQYIRNYIYLEPGADLLTIRGYFKTFNYKQTNALLSGTDLSAKYQWTAHFESNIRASILLARNLTQKDWLILMPADRITVGSKYSFDISPVVKQCYVSFNTGYVLQQQRIPANFDSIDNPHPPKAYFLLDAEVGTCINIKQQPMYISVSAANILNQRYRDYLDAFRYFIDQPGRNVALRIRVPFSINQKTI